MWMKWRHKFAWGTEKDWNWKDLGNVGDGKIAAVEACEELAQEYSYSDKYRGLDYELAETPPIEVLREHLEEALDRAAGWQERAEALRCLIDAEEAKPKPTTPGLVDLLKTLPAFQPENPEGPLGEPPAAKTKPR